VTKPVVLKLGGELLEDPKRMKEVARAVARMAGKGPLVVVHGGGKEIDAALSQASIPKHQVDGLRITDDATLQVVVSVLAGSINTRFVAAINAAGAPAVGLTGADAGVVPVKPARPHQATNGETVDLGLVGEPLPSRSPKLIKALCAKGFVPIVACIAASKEGQLFNVNADTLAGNLAARIRAKRLVVAGATPGVLGAKGRTITTLDGDGIDKLVSTGKATAGMIAKLRACRKAAKGGVHDVVIADGRQPKRLIPIVAGRTTRRKGAWTRIEK
jgi:acetylglutamate kinase